MNRKKRKAVAQRPTRCPYCGSPVELRSADGIYQRTTGGKRRFLRDQSAGTVGPGLWQLGSGTDYGSEARHGAHVDDKGQAVSKRAAGNIISVSVRKKAE